MKPRILNIFLTFLLLSSIIPSYVSAQSNLQFFYESINPDFPIRYTIKRIFEKLEEQKINLFSRDQKVKFMTRLSNIRLSEFKYIVDKKYLFYLETSSSRYISQLGLLSEELDRNKTDAQYIASNVGIQIKILESIKDKFPAQSAQWLLVQQALDTSRSVFSKTSELSK